MLFCAWFCLLLFYIFIYVSVFSSACVKNKVLRWNSVVLVLERRLPGLLTLPAVHIGWFVFRICLNSNSKRFAKIWIHLCISNKTLCCCYIRCRRFFSPAQEAMQKVAEKNDFFLKVNFICKEKNLHLSKKPKINSWKKNRTKGSRLKIVCVFGFFLLCFILFFCSVGN